MSPRYTLGLDVGTTNSKIVLYNERLEVIDSAYTENNTYRDHLGMAEQQADEIYLGVKKIIKDITGRHVEIKGQIQSLSLSSAMHSVLLISDDDTPLSPLYTWADNRANDTLKEVRDEGDLDWIYRRTGTPIHSMSPFSKLIWLKKTQFGILEEAKKIVGIKEYITYKLTGEWKVDYSIASATGLFNLEQLDWDDDILEMVGINYESLSEPVDTDYLFCEKNLKELEELGFNHPLAIHIGASDGVLSNVGLGAINQGEAALTIGTSGAIRVISDEIKLDDQGRTFCYYLKKDTWVIGGAVNNGGNTLAWLSTLFETTDLVELNARAEEVPAGSDGVLFYPYLNGERAPLWDASATGHFIGIKPIHTKGHFVRAVMEGVMYNLYDVYQVLTNLVGDISIIKVTGGFLKSDLWKRIAANVFNHELIESDRIESSCLGAVILNMKDNQSNITSKEQSIKPDQKEVESYSQSLAVYQELFQPILAIHALKSKRVE